MRRGVGGLQLHRRTDQPHGLLRLPESRHGDAQEMQRIPIERLAGEQLAIHRHGLGDAALVLQRKRPCERGCAGHPRADSGRSAREARVTFHQIAERLP